MTLADRVRAWIAADPDQASRDELQRLLDAGDEAALAERFAGPLTFGTAGLRGPMRAGPNGMNVAVVRRAAAGLAAFLRDTCAPRPAVVIGYDARHSSARFAIDSARVMAAAGLDVSLLPGALPTPVLAYLVRARQADAGVVVTASHNPPRDNGYKVYLGGQDAAAAGALLIPPQDEEIEQAIAAAPPAAELPLSSAFSTLGPEVVDGYLDGVVNLLRTEAREVREVRIAYTPLHGVGAVTLLTAFDRAGFPAPAVVAAQAEPDPEFPTVAFPNPEEPGATDLLLALAAQVDADIGIANDPDGDRCAVTAGGRMLSGDELGLLLADHILTSRADRTGTLVATTLVSSSALPALARARCATCVTTPTGFKWLVRAGAGESAELVYAYEEALGYAVGLDLVRDKDGISAALMAAELAAVLKAGGKTLIDRLDELAGELGLFSTAHVSARTHDASAGQRAIQRLLDEPPEQLGGLAVRQVHDLNRPEGGPPPTDGVRLEIAGGRVVVRPSGTEPKIKAYVEVVTPPHVVARDVPAARAAAADRLSDIAADLRPLLEDLSD